MISLWDRSSKFLVSHSYKWILPVLSTAILLVWADVPSMSILIVIILWLLLMVAYLSMPWNYENPKREMFEGYLLNRSLFAIFVPLQAPCPGLAVFGMTFILCKWFIPPLSDTAFLIAIVNGLLYSVTIWFESTWLRNRFSRK